MLDRLSPLPSTTLGSRELRLRLRLRLRPFAPRKSGPYRSLYWGAPRGAWPTRSSHYGVAADVGPAPELAAAARAPRCCAALLALAPALLRQRGRRLRLWPSTLRRTPAAAASTGSGDSAAANTSTFLLAYKEPQRSQILDWMFKPG